MRSAVKSKSKNTAENKTSPGAISSGAGLFRRWYLTSGFRKSQLSASNRAASDLGSVFTPNIKYKRWNTQTPPRMAQGI